MQGLRIQERVLQQFSPEEQELLRPQVSSVLGMEVVVKFHKNQIENQRARNPFVSWTLNKVAVIDKGWLRANSENNPVKDRDWWRVKIESETSSGQAIGCFVVRPLWKVEREELAIFAPSTFELVQKGLTVLMYPKMKPWLPWVTPKGLRRAVMSKTGGASLIIPLSYPPEGQPEGTSTYNEGLPSYMLMDPDLDDLNDVL